MFVLTDFRTVQFQETPKAFANFSPGLELATTLGAHERKEFNAESVGQIALANAFSVRSVSSLNPGLKQPWATISERLRRICKLNQYRICKLNQYRICKLNQYRICKLNQYRICKLNQYRICKLNQYRICKLNQYRVFKLNSTESAN
jgi:hypothetical protein